jgi:tetratricopeptide (TPR) repeat protein
MNCPVCRLPVKETALECACGESLLPWQNMAQHASNLRQRGLALASQADFLGALLAFLEAALANPLDRTCLVDAAKALFWLGRSGEALRLLGQAESLAPTDGKAAALAAAIRQYVEQARPQRAAGERPEDAPLTPGNGRTGAEEQTPTAPVEAPPEPLSPRASWAATG